MGIELGDGRGVAECQLAVFARWLEHTPSRKHRRGRDRRTAIDAVERLFVRLSGRVGFRARPHMLRHSFASEVAVATKDPALVKELLGHASVSSTDVYLHARWADICSAVDELARAREVTR